MLPFRQRSGDVQGDFHFLFQISAICSAVNSEAKHSCSRACSSSRTARSHHRCSRGLPRTSTVRSPDEAFALESSWTATTLVGRSISAWWREGISRCFLHEPRPRSRVAISPERTYALRRSQALGFARSPDHRPPLQKDCRRVSHSAHPKKDRRQTPERWHRLSAPARAADICSRKSALGQPTSQSRQKNAPASSPSSAAEESRAGKSIELPALPCFRLDGQHQAWLSLVRAPRRLDSNIAVKVRAS